MKKALSVFLMAAMAFGAFADEPVADVKVAEFSGNAAVTWGVDLDSGTTGFKNDAEVSLKLNLLNGGSKSTTGDGVWGELVIKTDGNTFEQWKGNGALGQPNSDKGLNEDGKKFAVKVDTAKIHFGPAYVGITSGDTQTGKLKMDAAVRSAGNDNSVWITDKGPTGYTQGIVAGYDSDMFKVDLDLRSKPGTGNYQYTDNYAVALEGEFKGVENLSVKTGVSYNFAENYQAQSADKDKTAIGEVDMDDPTKSKGEHVLGYSASAGYKLGLNDTFFVRPQVGFAGATELLSNDLGKLSKSSAEMAFGVLLGWGDIGQDKNAGVYYLDGDMAKNVTPGVGVVAYVPLATTYKIEPKDGDSMTKTSYDTVAARIMPSFYSGEIVPGLTAAAYGDIVVPKTGKDSDDTTYDAGEDKATAMAFALGAKYAIGVNEMTITPQFGLRFANAAYVNYEIAENNKAVFDKMGDQKDKTTVGKDGITSDGNYMNMQLGVDVAGLIDNTTLSVNWATANILNAKSSDTANIKKLGTLNFKAKIAL